VKLEANLEKLERFSAKIWRRYSKADPISQLSFNEYDYLKVIQSSSLPLRLTDLANEMEVSKPSVSNMVKRLKNKGLVQTAQCQDDARSYRVSLTDTACEHLADEAKVYAVVAEQVTKHLSEEEALCFNMLLSKVLL
jgi:DNA-binding MarR family transcriptional regulator